MKKQYIKPSFMVVKMDAVNILAGSIEGGGNTNQDLSRQGRGFWDDDEDEY